MNRLYDPSIKIHHIFSDAITVFPKCSFLDLAIRVEENSCWTQVAQWSKCMHVIMNVSSLLILKHFIEYIDTPLCLNVKTSFRILILTLSSVLVSQSLLTHLGSSASSMYRSTSFLDGSHTPADTSGHNTAKEKWDVEITSNMMSVCVYES